MLPFIVGSRRVRIRGEGRGDGGGKRSRVGGQGCEALARTFICHWGTS